MIEIRVLDEPNQKFSLVLNAQRITLRFWYSVFNDRWSIDVSVDGDPVLTGRKVVAGVNLLEPFNLGIGMIFAWSEGGDEPGRDALPLGLVKMYHATEEELDAAVAS